MGCITAGELLLDTSTPNDIPTTLSDEGAQRASAVYRMYRLARASPSTMKLPECVAAMQEALRAGCTNWHGIGHGEDGTW